MLAIKLSDGTTTIDLPSDLQWQDEFAWTTTQQNTDYTLTGSLVVQEGQKQDGRPITLFGGQSAAWISRSTLLLLQAMANASPLMVLSLWGTDYTVKFRAPPLNAEPIRRQADPASDHQYGITINLMEVSE